MPRMLPLNVATPRCADEGGGCAISPVAQSHTIPRPASSLWRANLALARVSLRAGVLSLSRFFHRFSVRLFQHAAETDHRIFCCDADVMHLPQTLRFHGSQTIHGDDLCFARKTKSSIGVHP